MDNTRAFMWPEEDFTRLTSSSVVAKNLVVLHQPMKYSETYASPNEYRNLVLPLLFSEWKANSRPFKKENKTLGSLESSTFFETIHNEDHSENLFGVQVVVPKTNFWQMSNRLNINFLTVEMDAIKVHNYSFNKTFLFLYFSFSIDSTFHVKIS